MFKSKEIRWFYHSEFKEISEWFGNNGYSFENSEPRTDHYLKIKDQEDIGIKLREGNIEIKQRLQRSEKENITKQANGYFEKYIKWSFTSAEEDPLFNKIIEEDKYHWLAVKKERIGYKLKENKNGSIIKVKIEEFPDYGCQVEYTRLKVKNELWYTVCLEWFGEKELKFDLSILNNMLGENQLKAENSMGYAEFLNRFAESKD